MFQEFFRKGKVALFLGSCLGPVWMEITIFEIFYGAPSEILALGTQSESLGTKIFGSKFCFCHENKKLFNEIFWLLLQNMMICLDKR